MLILNIFNKLIKSVPRKILRHESTPRVFPRQDPLCQSKNWHTPTKSCQFSQFAALARNLWRIGTINRSMSQTTTKKCYISIATNYCYMPRITSDCRYLSQYVTICRNMSQYVCWIYYVLIPNVSNCLYWPQFTTLWYILTLVLAWLKAIQRPYRAIILG